MPVIRTDRWLGEWHDDPVRLCRHLVLYFPDANERDIYFHLVRYGMYKPSKNMKETIKQMKQKNIWERVEAVYEKRKKKWNGPDVPLFLFPADPYNRVLAREFNSKGGIAFHDKLFIFLLPHHTDKEIEALITHEYNHVCRLKKQMKESEDTTLLDAIILEGLAENAVCQYVGKEQQARWTTYYSDEQLYSFWKRYVSPHKSIFSKHPLYARLLYGLGFYPTMLGYAVGHYIVRRCLEHGARFSELMNMDSEQILQAASLENNKQS
ncbi:DUF2268 domain-containing protein [Parageobacillus thermoglucosidasius]|uniref:DUF2268 domain-containing protein n=1 Tax=Parageobacillus thermoglucosidasius TaxID=1426 RepID=UPI0001D170B7|nr:DUF2268 domain-containing protein [Parageobacillus thermoglucosidasius]AEH48934.1 Protein of unknown function DUF2268, Zn-dependent protease-related protein [Parageobacillus thermoglucosidasius C56-YS93]MED4903155.1 DUF2268 domain-containing protein [Parageobacillus thermoglucosidasius]MED4915052.1 DUF2268 domain-containing protein [Parageobacillus thermoglucosidasius]MED4946059.1 DUF2268 domain-containing protein [Parageobacillus thermoglucosidasius]MED4981573.1 DUF2268 domain-containing p